MTMANLANVSIMFVITYTPANDVQGQVAHAREYGDDHDENRCDGSRRPCLTNRDHLGASAAACARSTVDGRRRLPRQRLQLRRHAESTAGAEHRLARRDDVDGCPR